MSMSKRIRCKYYAQGTCYKGGNCDFLHERRAPSRTVCNYYQRGICTYGSNCRYEHVKPTRSWHVASSSSASLQSEDSDPAPQDLFSSSIFGGVNSRGKFLGDPSSKKSSVPCRLWHGASSSSAALQVKVPQSVPQPLSSKSALGCLSSSSAHVSASKKPMISECYDCPGSGNPVDLTAERQGHDSICSLAAEGNCPHGEKCPHIHGDLCDTCGKHCLHPQRPQEREEHAKACEKKQKQLEAMKLSEEIECSVCFDRIMSKPTAAERKFGILSECDHPFCITCIRNWRRSSSTSGMDMNSASRCCPICRKLSYFVIPSDIWYTTKEEKESIINNYKARLKSIDCKHFNFGNGNCPFGTSCFYKHTVEPGSYAWIHHRPPPPPRRRNRANMNSMLDALEQLWSLNDLIGVGEDDDGEEDMDYLHDLNYLIDPGDNGFDSDNFSPMDMAFLLHRLGFDSSDASSDEEEEDEEEDEE